MSFRAAAETDIVWRSATLDSTAFSTVGWCTGWQVAVERSHEAVDLLCSSSQTSQTTGPVLQCCRDALG